MNQSGGGVYIIQQRRVEETLPREYRNGGVAPFSLRGGAALQADRRGRGLYFRTSIGVE